jgi:hypothetical protein
MTIKKEDCILYSGGAAGAEAEFGAQAEAFGIEEVNYTIEGHRITRTRGQRYLNHEDLMAGDVSLEYVSRLMNRRYSDSPTLRKILQSIWYQINRGQEIYVVGEILEDQTVKGGTGWGAEFAKLCNKPLFVYDQKQGSWAKWETRMGLSMWLIRPDIQPVITHTHFTGTGTRQLEDNGRRAIRELFARSFGRNS